MSGTNFTTGKLGSLSQFVIGMGIPLMSSPGEGFRGRMPAPIIGHNNNHEFAQTRFILRDSWNTTRHSGSSNRKRMVTPFRAVYNAGDLLCRENYSCGGTCQSYQSRPGLKGLSAHFGSNSNKCMPSVVWSEAQLDPSIPASTCNSKFVYDSSDYIRFKKNQALNKNYNDRSFGGNDSFATQSVVRRVRS
jgi:hypothetical protein